MPSDSDHIPQRPPFIPGTPEELDAVAAAPENHTVFFENEYVRVLRDNIPPGVVEKKHTHARPSIFVINASLDMDYYNEEGETVARSGKLKDGEPFWVEPEGLHWLENHDTFAFDAIRVEIKV
ncbi:MAG: hypothetical protein QF701_10405 [Nitrospinota bacterium]|jgi:hypothetical protein|nr:hypothetical protein [Nitrospinota bacterium]MDP7371344.1 hypothetical protein [Nitrospinota bacterium]MDP7505091.1 hypothetical protein [Nitrospinota bacterium]MDP7663699.1 hypothetical protein [Nitrospinota bacterium]